MEAVLLAAGCVGLQAGKRAPPRGGFVFPKSHPAISLLAVITLCHYTTFILGRAGSLRGN